MTPEERRKVEREHDYTHCPTHGPHGGLYWCARCPACRPNAKKETA